VMGAIPLGDGDTLVEGAAVVVGPGGFDTTAELVIVSGNIAGGISASAAASRIGSATADYVVGGTALFAVDNGIDTALFRFTSSDGDAVVGESELTLLATLQGTASVAIGDFVFVT
jgi:hypothetical protein